MTRQTPRLLQVQPGSVCQRGSLRDRQLRVRHQRRPDHLGRVQDRREGREQNVSRQRSRDHDQGLEPGPVGGHHHSTVR